MAEKIPGKPRKSTSRKKETEQKSQKASPVTPIDQHGLGQSQGKTSQPPTLAGSRSGQSESSAQDRAGQFSSQRGAHPSADQSGAVTPSRLPIPSAKDAERMGPANPARTAIPDRAKAAQSGNPGAGDPGAVTPSRANPARAGDPGAGKTPNSTAKSAGSSPSVLNPSGSVQEGRHGSGARPSGQELQERIRARAYELFEQRGRQEGFHQQDWAQAEAEVLSEFEREKSA